MTKRPRRPSTAHAASQPPAVWVCLGLVAAVALLYGQVATHDFLLLDDPDYVVENPWVVDGLTSKGAVWAFSATHAGNWHPLTWLSHMLDTTMFGLDAGSHLLVNAGLHAANAVLLFLALRLMTGAGWSSALVAALFALHPLRVESVAWVSERKDLMAGLFWMLTLLAYAGYARRETPLRYLAVVALFALGLMSKPMLVTLPFVLLLLDVWPLGRWRAEVPTRLRLLLEKLPLLALATASSVITLLAQQGGRALSSLESAPFAVRLTNALVVYATYLWKTVWPSGLACLYPHPMLIHDDALGALIVPAVGASLLLSAITALVIYRARQRTYLPVGWLWFLGTLVPVIGIVQVGAQSWADRYTYLPLIGIYIMIAWSLADLTRRVGHRNLVVTAVVAVLAAYGAAAYVQVGTWRDSRTLYEHAARVTRDNGLIHKRLGNMYLHRNDLTRAAGEFERALALEPDFPQAHSGLGDTRVRQGDLAAAARHYEEAVRLSPDFSEAWHNLGVVHATLGRPARAIPHYERALRINPSFAQAHNNLGLALETQGRTAEAAEHYQRALRIQPDYPAAHDNLQRVRP